MRRSGLRPQSPQRRREAKERARVVAVVLERDGGCRARDLIEHECAGPLDVHEIIPRSAWRAGYLEPSNVVMVCRRIHDWIGDHPDEANALGLHAFSWQRPGGHLGRDGDAA